jgi:hypothetical protein
MQAIVDHLFARAKRKQKRHVYFSQASLSRVVRSIEKEIRTQDEAAKIDEADYQTESTNVFHEWLKFDQYRKLLIFDEVFPFIVVTDVTNFFESVLLVVSKQVYGLAVSSRIVSLLFSYRICRSGAICPIQRSVFRRPLRLSRTLAHMILFPHDDRMVKLVGENAYIKWMDDQYIGVQSRGRTSCLE